MSEVMEELRFAATEDVQTIDVAVVGGGLGGLYALYRLRRLGLAVKVFEAGSGVGGT